MGNKYDFDTRDAAARKYDELLDKYRETGELSEKEMSTFSFLMLDILEMTENPLTVLRQAHQLEQHRKEQAEQAEQRRQAGWSW
jgi:hypothetical protein